MVLTANARIRGLGSSQSYKTQALTTTGGHDDGQETAEFAQAMKEQFISAGLRLQAPPEPKPPMLLRSWVQTWVAMRAQAAIHSTALHTQWRNGLAPRLSKSLVSWCYHPMVISTPALKTQKASGLVFRCRKNEKLERWVPNSKQGEKKGLACRKESRREHRSCCGPGRSESLLYWKVLFRVPHNKTLSKRNTHSLSCPTLKHFFTYYKPVFVQLVYEAGCLSTRGEKKWIVLWYCTMWLNRKRTKFPKKKV